MIVENKKKMIIKKSSSDTSRTGPCHIINSGTHFKAEVYRNLSEILGSLKRD